MGRGKNIGIDGEEDMQRETDTERQGELNLILN